MKIRSLFASIAGNTLEWYDFGLFIYCGPIFSNLIFPHTDKYVNYLYLYATFAVSFLCRPLGGIILGHIGDKYGRSKALLISILLISIPTFLIAFLPTYAQIGIWSPILLFLIRILQGVSIGGEFSGTIIYLAESSPKSKKAFFTSFAATGANAGFFIGVGLTAILENILNKTNMQAFGWRIEFFFGGLFAIFILYLRKYLVETPVFLKLHRDIKNSKSPIIEAIKKYFSKMLMVIGIVSFGATLYYVTFVYLGSFLSTFNNFSLEKITNIQTCFIASMFVLVPLFAILCDHIGRKKMYMIFCSVGILSAYIVFYFFQFGSEWSIIISIALLTILSSMEQATSLVTVVEIIPVNARYTALSTSYNLGYLIFGGLTPFAITGLTKLTHDNYIPAFFLILSGIFTLFTILKSKDIR